MIEGKWIGVDLDGTLAHYSGHQGHQDIGEPIIPMLSRVDFWIRNGYDVRIFTARVHSHQSEERREEARTAINRWCMRHLGRHLPTTAEKDYLMEELWDDRAIQVVPNTGRRVDGRP